MTRRGLAGLRRLSRRRHLAHGLSFLPLLGGLLLVHPARAELEYLVHAEVQTGDTDTVSVTLPYFVHQDRSGLIRVHWTLTLPEAAQAQRLPALLLPQPVQGLTVRVGAETVYALPVSSPDTLHHWYRPVLIPLPHVLIDSAAPVRIQIEQTGHLRGWYIAPVLQGELSELQPWHDQFLLLSSTLPTTVNLLSMLVGLFVLAIGWRTRSVTYAFGGLTTVVWGVLFSLALTPELPLRAWFPWRLMLYACTGNLIYVVLRFLATFFQQRWPAHIHWPVLLTLQLGWIVFALVGSEAEPVLDVIWTAIAVGLYVTGSLMLVARGLQQREHNKVLVLGSHGVLTAVLAWHDYVLQAGELPATWLQALPQPWYALLLQPVYLTHLSLPVFVVISLWLLAQDHLRHRHQQSLHEQALHAQRDRITRDIHDGVGARLNLMLWRTRTSPLVASQLQDELERSIEELRFAINPHQAANQTFTEALRGLCNRSARWGQPLGIEVRFDEQTSVSHISPEQGLHLYKAAHEGLSNALRHSQASCVTVQLSADTHWVWLTIEDNGCGIPACSPHDNAHPHIRATAMGLRGMQHRLQALGGECLIESGPQGTRLTMSLPISTPQHSPASGLMTHEPAPPIG